MSVAEWRGRAPDQAQLRFRNLAEIRKEAAFTDLIRAWVRHLK